MVDTEVGAEVPGAVGTGICSAISGGTDCSATYELRIEEGDTAIPSMGVATLRPSSNFTKTVYLSVHRLDGNGEKVIIATDSPHQEDCAVIVTCSGGIVDAKTKSNPWVDLNGTNHLSKKIGNHVKGGQADFLLGCVEEQLKTLRGDIDTLKKLFAGSKGEEEGVITMLEEVKKLRKTVEDLMKRPA